MTYKNGSQFTWDSKYGKLIFEFTISGEPVPYYMAVVVYAKSNPSDRLFRESFDGNIIYVNANVNGRPLNGRLWMINKEGHGYVDSDLSYGLTPLEQNLEGALVEYYFNGPPFPPIPPDPPFPPDPPLPPIPPDAPEESNTVMMGPEPEPLFPYIDIEPWPAIPAATMALHFVQFQPLPEGTGSDLYYQLLNAAREQAISDSIAWIESPAFISSPAQLEGPIAFFAELDRIADREEKFDPEELLVWLAFELECELEYIYAYLTSDAYKNSRDAVWQSWFALVVVNGYRPDIFNFLTRTLVFCHFAETVAQVDPLSPPSSPPLFVMPPGFRKVDDLLHASILLPSPLFPLPPFITSDPVTPPAREKGWVVPYAVGKLRLVKHRLIGYRGGELAHVENVMKGEKRKTSRRKLQRTEDEVASKEKNANVQSNGSEETKNNFEKEAERAAAESFTEFTYSNLNSVYGPPSNFTLNGSWQQQSGDATPMQSSASGFAQRVVTNTLQNIRRTVEEQRKRIHTDESEEAAVSIFDNSEGDRNLRGVYRWLNKIYEARIVQYGSRLLVEFMIKNPARTFIAECRRLYGLHLEIPRALRDFHIRSFTDVTIDSVNYIEAQLYYNLPEIPPAPAAVKTVSFILQPGQTQNILLPEGYQASNAVVTLPLCSSQTDLPVINGIIGQNAFSNSQVDTSSSPVSYTPYLSIPLNQETGSVPAALFDIIRPQQNAVSNLPSPSAPLSPPEPNSPPAPPPAIDYAVTIEISCAPTQETVLAWQVRVYRLLNEAYEKRMQQYRDRLFSLQEIDGKILPPDTTPLERMALRNDCMDQLFNVFYTKTGVPSQPLAASPPGLFNIYEPVIAQFFSSAFEWSEMSYTLTADLFGYHGATQQRQETLPPNKLSAFLQADYARVLVPVPPSMSLAVLYFLATGTIWQDRNSQAPVTEESISAAHAIKTESPAPYAEVDFPAWTFEMPTTMLVLDDSGEDFLLPKKIQP